MTRSRTAVARRPATSEGFTLLELLISMSIVIGLLMAVLTFFDYSSRLSRVQMHNADLQQSLRMAQTELVAKTRMTGRGPLPLTRFPSVLMPNGLGVGVENNVPAGTQLASCDCAPVLEGTDVLTLRGVFSSSVYQVSPTSTDFDLSLPDSGTLILRNLSPTGVPQDLQAIKRAIESTQAGNPEALLLVSPVDDAIYALVEIQPASTVSPATGTPETATLQFLVQGGTHTADYLNLSPGGAFPAALQTVAYAGLVEEYRYYVRADRATPGDPSSDLIPRLSKAQFFPGTQVAYGSNTGNLRVDVADNVFDLQIALGIDVDQDEVIDEGADPSDDDEWLFNHPGDDASDTSLWNGTIASPTRLYYVRINTLGRAARADPKFQADLLTMVEDKNYAQSPFSEFNNLVSRRFRRRAVQAVVDLRNLS